MAQKVLRALLEHPIDLRSAAAERTSNRSDFFPRGPSSLHSSSINPSLATSVATLSLGPFDTFALTLFDEASLHLGRHAEPGDDDVPHFAPRADERIKNSDRGAALLAFVD